MTALPVVIHVCADEPERDVQTFCRSRADGRPECRSAGRPGLETRSPAGGRARTEARSADTRSPIVHPPVAVPLPAPETGEARYVIFTVLLGSWLVAVTAAKVLIPPVPLLVFLLARMVARRRRRARA